MAKQSNYKKSIGAEKLGKGKVTSFQVAFIVDRYLCDNKYTQTRKAFRSEASGLISGSPVQEAPKSLLSLGAMLDEYICLKEQRVLLNQERYRLDQDKLRVQNLLKGLQGAMSAFNASAHLISPPLTSPNLAKVLPASGPLVTAPEPPTVSPASGCYSELNTPMVLSRSNPNGSVADPSSVSISTVNHTSLKRKGFRNGSDAPPTTKRHQKSSTSKSLNPKETKSQGHINGQPPWKALAYESNPNSNASTGPRVVKCLFTRQDQSLPNTSTSVPKTPPLSSSSSSQNEKSSSPLELHSSATSSKNMNQELTTNHTITSTETIQVSPSKNISYYSITRNHQVSTFSPIKRPNTRDHVKGKLNFDVIDDQSNTEVSASDPNLSPETDIFDLDLEALGNINLSELLIDFDIDGPEETFQPHSDSTPESTFCYEAKSGDAHNENNGFMSQISSTVTQIQSDKETNSSGIDNVTSTTRKSVTKCIKMISPAKNQSRLMDQEPYIRS